MSEQRVFSGEFKEGVVRRMLNGKSVSALHKELAIKRSVLYRWRDADRKEGVAGLQRVGGRPPGVPNPPKPAGEAGAAAALRRLAQTPDWGSLRSRRGLASASAAWTCPHCGGCAIAAPPRRVSDAPAGVFHFRGKPPPRWRLENSRGFPGGPTSMSVRWHRHSCL
jgi:transposase-like protein